MVISFLFIGGCFFSYPDTVEAGITITTENPPAWIVARSTGKLKEVFLKDKQKVKAGELIGVVNNPADTREVLLLKKELEALQELIFFVKRVEFGMENLQKDIQKDIQKDGKEDIEKGKVIYSDFAILAVVTAYGYHKELLKERLHLKI